LWTSDFVNYSGTYYTLKDAKLYTKPKGRIPIYVAANGPKAAELVGKYADGWATVDPVKEGIKDLWPLIDQAAKESGRDAGEFVKNVELFISYSQDYQEALASARKWKTVLIPNILNLPIDDPRELERQGNAIPDEELEKAWTITTDPEAVIKKAEDAITLGYNEIQLHSASPSEEKFLNMCNKHVLPYLKEESQHS
jgi:coenzyme F420-dependent glucose-6-phosphate dehydrogenase